MASGEVVNTSDFDSETRRFESCLASQSEEGGSYYHPFSTLIHGRWWERAKPTSGKGMNRGRDSVSKEWSPLFSKPPSSRHKGKEKINKSLAVAE